MTSSPILLIRLLCEDGRERHLKNENVVDFWNGYAQPRLKAEPLIIKNNAIH